MKRSWPKGVYQAIPAALSHPTGTPASYLRGRPSSWSWDLTLAGTDSRYQVGTLPVLGIFSPPQTPKILLLLASRGIGHVDLTQSRPHRTSRLERVSQPIPTFSGWRHRAPKGVAAGCRLNHRPRPLTKPHRVEGTCSRPQSSGGEGGCLCLNKKTTSFVRPPFIHRSP